MNDYSPKARRVYYTGRGYFLVTPEKGPELGKDQRKILRRLVDSNTQTEEPTYETPAAVEGWRSHSPKSPPSLVSNLSSSLSSTSAPFETPSLVADSRVSHHCRLGRSQSLRGQRGRENLRGQRRDGRRDGWDRGGSLRLSCSQASKILEEERNSSDKMRGRKGEESLRRVLSGDDGLGSDGSKGVKTEPEVGGGIQGGRKLERKNSLLSRIFGRKKSGDEEAVPAKEEKEIRVFSAQFPPPDINIPKVHMKAKIFLKYSLPRCVHDICATK